MLKDDYQASTTKMQFQVYLSLQFTYNHFFTDVSYGREIFVHVHESLKKQLTQLKLWFIMGKFTLLLEFKGEIKQSRLTGW